MGEKKGFFSRLVEGLTKTRDNIVSGIDSVFHGFSKIDDEFYEELEEILIMGDLGVKATEAILDDLREKVKANHVKEPAECKQLLIDSIKQQMQVGETAYRFEEETSVVLVIGVNGVGKTTFLKTAAGFLPPVSGEYQIGNQVTIGYFDQNSAQIQSEKTVLEHFHELFPSMTEKDVRQTLGAYLFGGKDAAKKVSSLSGGEKSRLVLAELLQSRPNFLILDEPTNHMDVAAKETLESAFRAYTGTILFVSHDRYFLKQVAESVMIFENQTVMYYPFGYEHYLEKKEKQGKHESLAAQIKAEEQALIAGMRAVPKAERHRLREFSTEEAYTDWKLRLAAEPMEVAKEQVEMLAEALEQMMIRWQQSEGFWNGDTWDEEAAYRERLGQYEEAVKRWQQACLKWAETAMDWEPGDGEKEQEEMQ